MNILDQHIAELHAAQERFNSGIEQVHEIYASDVQRSRDKLLAALNGETPTPFERLDTVAARVMPAIQEALETEE